MAEAATSSCKTNTATNEISIKFKSRGGRKRERKKERETNLSTFLMLDQGIYRGHRLYRRSFCIQWLLKLSRGSLQASIFPFLFCAFKRGRDGNGRATFLIETFSTLKRSRFFVPFSIIESNAGRSDCWRRGATLFNATGV